MLSAEGQEVSINRSRERALLALMLVNRDSTLQRESIVEALWEEAPPDNPRAALQTAVSRLRSSLGALADRVVTSGTGYGIELRPHDFDADIVEMALVEAEAMQPESAAGLLDEVEKMWRGPAYEELRYSEFAQAEVRRLDELRMRVVGQRIQSELALGHHDRLIPELRGLVTAEPLHEGLWRSLMISLYRAGRQADALRAFQETRTHLSELGIEPSPELVDLEMSIPEWPTPDMALSLKGVAAVRLANGEPVRAAFLLGAASLVRQLVQTPAEWWTSAGATAALSRLELGEASFEAAWQEGQSADMRAVFSEALT